jgi:hypothetical protein
VKVTKTVTHHVRMGPYESFVVGTSVEVEVPPDVKIETVLDQADMVIADALAPDIEKARALAVDDSYIQDWGK